jgi:hypothetical protein
MFSLTKKTLLALAGAAACAAGGATLAGATVLRVESGGPAGSAYHAHVRKADGSKVVVLVNASFEATSVAEPLHR